MGSIERGAIVTRRRAGTMAAVALLALVPGCAAPSGELKGSESALAESYSSLEELSEHASLIVQGVAADSERVTVEGAGFVIAEVEVSRVLKGSAQDVVHVRQTGDGYFEDTYPVAPALTQGTDYVLYLKPFEVVPGNATDEFVVLGVGAFEVEGRVVILPEQASWYEGFPDRTGLDEVEELAQRSG